MTLVRYHCDMNETWTPDISGKTGTIHSRLLRALRRDIASGKLAPEGRMPTHRELARRLGIGVGTVTRAYAEAERLGLLTSAVGRGTFVAPAAAPAVKPAASMSLDPASGPIDLSLNLPTLDAVQARIGEALHRVHTRPDIGQLVALAPHAGLDAHRQAMAGWLRNRVRYANVDWTRLVITTGAQQAMALAIEVSCRPNDVLLTEAATFGGIFAIAASRGLTCTGVAMDEHGIMPDALEATIADTGARVVYLQPTLQNPTTRTMPMERREKIVEIARRHDLTLIEDDVCAPIAFALDNHRPELTPLAVLAPERTFYLSSFSKALSPGLRVGMLVAPDRDRFDRVCMAMRAACYTTATLGSLIVTQWIKDGVADQVLGAVAQEASTRLVIARRLLGGAMDRPTFPTSLHAWLPMSELRAERVANGALRRGVVLTPPSSILVDGGSVSGLRICLNMVTRPELERALRIIRSVLADEVVPSAMSVV